MAVDERYIYLDYAATAPLCPEAASAMAPFLDPGRGNLAVGMNANSLHSPGRAAFAAMEQARKDVAAAIGARPGEVVFTSGATEADDSAIFGLALAARDVLRRTGNPSFQGHVITSAIEHDAVLAPVKRLEAQGFEVTRLAPDRDGFIELRALESAIRENTVLVSVQMANSEVGSVQPVRQLADITHKAGALFHTDAVQALGKIDCNMARLDVDAASFSAHKIGGPKGIGALYLRARTPFSPFMLGGGQENGRRSGTQNVCAMAAFAAAAQAAVKELEDEAARLRLLRDRLYAGLTAFDGVQATVDVAAGSEDYLPNIVSVLVDGLESQTMILRFDKLGFGVSGGSACSSHSLEPSHVLRSMGIGADEAQGALRVSLGRYTTADDVEAFLKATETVLNW